MALNKNRARQAARDIAEEFDEDLPVGSADDFDPDAPEEFTDEDALEVSKGLSSAERLSMDRSRQRGRVPHAESRGHKTNDARENREHSDNDFAYRPLNSLDAPKARPGMEQRWIRVMVGDKNDVRNWSRQQRYHWVPRQLETVPDSFNPPTQQVGGLGEVIMVGDLVLCERDARYGQSRKKFMAEQHRRQVKATKRHVKKVERDGHEITVTDRDGTPTVGRGRRVKAQDDE